jgi:hypothetical protein
MTNYLPRISLTALAFALAAGPPALTAQDKSAALAKELTTLMQSRKIDSVAARHPAAADQFVAALTFPGQLMVVWARTTAPAILNEKLLRSEYRDVYIDLNSASIPASRVMITDGGADGLKARRDANDPIDFHDAQGKGIRFSGNWRENKMSEQDYMKAYTDAQQAYVVALEALLSELKKSS